MKTQIDLTDVSLNYLKELAKKYQVTESDIVEGLLIGFAVRNIGKKLKAKKKDKKKDKKIKNSSFGGETFNMK